jgi:acetoacetyl-CoA synthetase
MRQPLWTPSQERKRQANLTRFIEAVNAQHGLAIESYAQLYEWSVEHIPDFWAAMWEFGAVRASRPYERVVDGLDHFPGAKWFPGARLNFAENLLRYRDNRLAFIFRGETHTSTRMTYAELYETVARLAKSLRGMGVVAGDKVVGYMPNLIETAVAMLAAASVGATWSSCATDIGAPAALERLGQVRPKVLFTADGYFYKGKAFDTLAHAAEVAAGIPWLQKVVVVSYTRERPGIGNPERRPLGRFSRPSARARDPVRAIAVRSSAVHHVLVGDDRKAEVHGSGRGWGADQPPEGAAAPHRFVASELSSQFHIILYITSCSWMMWNWLLSSLATGATVVLYDGNPLYLGPGAMWNLIDEERITVFGCSASYLLYLKKEGYSPRTEHGLTSLREISQTGSPLSAEGFEYVYHEIKADLHFNSISGGTDINGCFAAGSPTLPVYAGELQSPALGMKVKAYDVNGAPILDEQGELVCEAPTPSMPLHFWEDSDGAKYHSAYFDVYPGVWRHGDYVLFHGPIPVASLYGRSDAVLKPSGVRIGTAEIYTQLEKLGEIADSLAVGQNWQGDQRVVLFVKLAPGSRLDDGLKEKIRRTLRENASPRHVPAVILAAPEIPYTLNMKKVVSAVTNILNGRAVSNRDALINPAALDF